jgi:hypothetical protein
MVLAVFTFPGPNPDILSNYNECSVCIPDILSNYIGFSHSTHTQTLLSMHGKHT